MMDTRKGVYITYPHGGMIHSGEKRAIAVARRVPIEGQRVICSKDKDGNGIAYGIAVIGDPGIVDVDTFDERFAAHRVPRSSRAKWWPDAQHLFLYPIQYFAPFDPIRPISVPPGITMDMSSDVKYLDVEDGDHHPFDGDSDGDDELVIMSSSDTINSKEKEEMPWKPSDATRFTKEADTPEKQREWAATANSRLEACLKDDGEQKECEASAIRVANAAVAGDEKDLSTLRKVLTSVLSIDDDDKMLSAITSLYDFVVAASDKAGDDGGGDVGTCTCPSCKEEADGDPDVPCKEQECPSCGAKMRGGDEEDKAVAQDEEEEDEGEDEDEGEEKKPKEEDEKPNRNLSKGVLDKLRDVAAALSGLVGLGESEPAAIEHDFSKSFKSLGTDPQGRDWFMICPTNAYQDREQETFHTKAIKDFIERNAANGIKGEAWFWHTDGSRFGTIREEDVFGDHFLCQFGTYDDTPVGNAFKSFFAKYPDSHPTIAPNGWGASHKFDYIAHDRDDKEYEYMNIRESTVLPVDAAANVHNLQPLLGGLKMSDERKAAIEAIGKEVGMPDLVEQITAQANARKEELDAQGVERKEIKDETAESVVSETSVPEVAQAVAETLQMDSLSNVLDELGKAVKSITERLDTLETTVTRTEDEIKQAAADELPRYSWFRASEADETAVKGEKKDEEIKTLSGDSPIPLPVQNLVGMMQRQ